MTPFWSDDHLTLYGGDCREVLRELPDESVHCVVTSPPYWGLRDYGTAAWEGGDEACDHKGKAIPTSAGFNERYFGRPSAEDNKQDDMRREVYRETCGKCGARRIDSQLGLEATPEEFVANMVAVFREVRRVLRKDGTLWLNLGDSYSPDHSQKRNAGWKGEGPSGNSGFHSGITGSRARDSRGTVPGLKPKDLVGIPWRVAFALQADGWYLRSDIIWAKPNPMPESVTDRPTKAHEYLFLLTRSPRYYYDAEAVREAPTRAYDGAGGGHQRNTVHGEAAHRGLDDSVYNPAGRNLRTVWNIATEPYPGAHFATFPRKLVEPCVKAGTSERGVCPECGAPWIRVVKRTPRVMPDGSCGCGVTHGTNKSADPAYTQGPQGSARNGRQYCAESETTGWKPSCYCGPVMAGVLNATGIEYRPQPVPAVVLDPFAGSGTTLFVAQALGRRGVGIDLSPDYLKQALERNRQTPLGLVG